MVHSSGGAGDGERDFGDVLPGQPPVRAKRRLRHLRKHRIIEEPRLGELGRREGEGGVPTSSHLTPECQRLSPQVFGQECKFAKQLLMHYRHCLEPRCPVCQPTREYVMLHFSSGRSHGAARSNQRRE